MNDGWVCIHRKIEENPIVCKDNDYFRVWHHLLYNATHKPIKVIFGKEKITLQPGQLITGRNEIAKKCNVQSSKVVRILNCFKNEQQIEHQTCSKGSLITVVNWERYQKNEQQIEQQVNNKRTTSEQQMNTNNNITRSTTATTNNNNACDVDLFEIVQKEFGRLISPMESEIVAEWLTYGLSDELILNAIKETVANGVYSLKYTQSILNRYRREGITSVRDTQKNHLGETSENHTGETDDEPIELFDYDWLEGEE